MTSVIVGMDVGKSFHEVVVMTTASTVVLTRRVGQCERELRQVLRDAQTYGKPALVVDQSSSIGTLPIAVAHEMGIPVLYMPGSVFHKVAATFPGDAHADRRDARILAIAGQSMPHTVRPLVSESVTVAELRVQTGYDDDLIQDMTREKNRIRAALHTMHPPLEAVLGPRLGNAGVLEMLGAWPTPMALTAVADAELRAVLRAAGSRRADALIAELRTALAAQELVIPGTAALGATIAYRAETCRRHVAEHRRITDDLARQVDSTPAAQLTRSMPGFGVKTSARVAVELAGKTFASAAHLASYAGVAPATRQSGTSIRSSRASRKSNRRLKDAFFHAALTTIRTGPTRDAYLTYRHSHSHRQAIIWLARKRTNVLYQILQQERPYDPDRPAANWTKT